jgi:uncharacterized protein YjbI with pentapeptide repeats
VGDSAKRTKTVAIIERLKTQVRAEADALRDTYRTLSVPTPSSKGDPDSLVYFPVALSVAIFAIPILGQLPPHFWTAQYWGGDNENRMEIMRNLALIIGGGLGLFLAWWRIIQKDIEMAFANQRHRDERFERAITLLESDIEGSRIAGLRALQQLAQQFPDDYSFSALQVICAFLRQRRRAEDFPKAAPVSAEFEAAFETIYALISVPVSKLPDAPIDLTGVAFDNMRLYNWNFTIINCRDATFRNCRLVGCNIRSAVREALSFQRATIRRATLHGHIANVDFSNATFLEVDLRSVHFRLCNFTNARFYAPRVSSRPTRRLGERPIFDRCDITECQFSADRRDLGFLRARLRKEPSTFRAKDFELCYVGKVFDAPPTTAENDPVLNFATKPAPEKNQLPVTVSEL